MTPRYQIGVGRARHKQQFNRFTNKEDAMAQVVITHDPDDSVFKVAAPYDEDWKAFAKEKDAKWDPDAKTWDFSDDDFSVRDIEQEAERFFPRATIILG